MLKFDEISSNEWWLSTKLRNFVERTRKIERGLAGLRKCVVSIFSLLSLTNVSKFLPIGKDLYDGKAFRPFKQELVKRKEK